MTPGTAVGSHLPGPKEIRDLLGELLDREVSLTPGPPFAPGPMNPATFGVYVEDSLRIAAVVAMDCPLSARAGAAIGLVPANGVIETIEKGRLDDVLRENVYEVFNIAASLFNAGSAAHVRLHAVHHLGDPMPGDVQARALTLGRRADLVVDIAGYGRGRLSVVLC